MGFKIPGTWPSCDLPGDGTRQDRPEQRAQQWGEQMGKNRFLVETPQCYIQQDAEDTDIAILKTDLEAGGR